MAIISISRDWPAAGPAMVRITSTDTLATIGTADYLTDQAAVISLLNNGAFSWDPTDTVLVSASDGWGLYSISADFTSLNAFSFTPGAQSASVAVSSAEFLGMYAAPKLLIPAPGANKLIIVDNMQLVMTYGSANYAVGGVVAAQYDTTSGASARVLATATEAAADFAAASTTFRSLMSTTIAPFSTTVNKGVYLSNATSAFTTGDSTFVAKVNYHVVATA